MGGERHPEESLAALIDGELSAERRERVLAHLVNCAACKSEAEAQRQLKNTFAQCALPAPPAGLMARLHGLPAGPLPTTGDDAPGGGSTRAPTTDRWPRREPFLSGRRGRTVAPVPVPVALPVPGGDSGLLGGGGPRGLPGGGGSGGLPVHRAKESAEGRGGAAGPLLAAARGGQRGHRLAFAAAGAFSLAAFAIGGAVTATPTGPVPSASGPPALASSGGSGPLVSGPGRTTGRDDPTYLDRALRSGAYSDLPPYRSLHDVADRALGSGLPVLFGGDPRGRVASGPAPHLEGPAGPGGEDAPAGARTPDAATPGATPAVTPGTSGTPTPH